MKKLVQSNIIFDELTHTYTTPEGVILSGVTSLMKKHHLSPDYTGIPIPVLQNAATRGKLIHKQIEDFDNGLNVFLTPEVAAWKLALTENKCKVAASEYLISDNELVASKIDKVFDDYSLADLKTTSTLHLDSLSWQLSIYAYLFEVMNRVKVPALYGVHIRDGKCKFVQIARKPDTEVKKLLDCEKQGIIYTAPVVEQNLPDIITEKDESLLIENEQNIEKLELAIKNAKEFEKELFAKIYDKMSDKGIKQIKTKAFTLSLIAEHTRETIDSKMLKECFPLAAEKCKKETKVSGSLRFSFNKQ